MTTYAYMRVSTLEQVDGTSLSNQKRECKGLAMTGGLYIETYIEDKGVSGATNFFERMTAHNVTLKAGDVVIVAKLRSDNRWRMAAKLNPDTYGDKAAEININLGDIALDALRKRVIVDVSDVKPVHGLDDES